MVEMPETGHDKEKIERLKEAMYSRTRATKLHERDRRELDTEKPLVGEEWRHEAELKLANIVAPRGMSAMRNVLWWILGISLIFCLGAISFFAYFFLVGSGSLPASPQNVDMVISGPPQVGGGEPVELQISVTNRNKIPLYQSELVIHYPKGTRSPGTVQADDFHIEECSGKSMTDDANYALTDQRICLGTLQPGESRRGTVTAVLSGPEASTGVVKSDLEYRVPGSNSVFVAQTLYSFLFTSAPLSVSIDSNAETTSGQPFQMGVNIVSNANIPVKDVLVKAEYPFGFKLSDATPLVQSENQWSLGTFNPGQKKTISIQGVMIGNAGDHRTFRFLAGTRNATSSKSIDTELARGTFDMTVSQPFLQLGLSVNEVKSPTVTLTPGEKVTVAVSYKNNLSVPITDAIIVAKLAGMQIDGTRVHSSSGFFRSSDDSVFWDKSTYPQLASLAPGETGTLSFQLDLPSGDDTTGLINPHLAISVNAAGKRTAENGVPTLLQSTARQTIALASDIQLIAEGLYYTNPFGSTGPMPPKANSETTYAIVFTVRNTTNGIKDAIVRATLPNYVRWVGIYSPATEKVTFNQLDSTVTWRLGDIAPGAGLGGTPPRQAAIAVGFTPSTSQIGQAPSLMSNIELRGTDATTSNPVSKKILDVTTNLANVSKSSEEIITAGDTGFTAANANVVK